MMWHKILVALIAHLKSHADLKGALIRAGLSQPLPEEPQAIDVRRGATEELTPYDAARGKETFWVECWVFGDEYPRSGYERLAELEQAAIAAIDAWLPGTATVGGAQINTAIVAVQPDGDLFRPHVGSRIVLSVEWRKQS